MKDLKLSITINKPVRDVFEFTINPENAPRWIDFIVAEHTNETPPKLGTIYRNQNTAGQWRELEMTAFEPDKTFVLTSKEDGFHVRYTFIPLDANTTELEYYVCMDNGELKNLPTINILEKLKQAVEES